jgi:hypothetical protein
MKAEWTGTHDHHVSISLPGDIGIHVHKHGCEWRWTASSGFRGYGYAPTKESAQSAAIAAVRAQCMEILEALP